MWADGDWRDVRGRYVGSWDAKENNFPPRQPPPPPPPHPAIEKTLTSQHVTLLYVKHFKGIMASGEFFSWRPIVLYQYPVFNILRAA